jgi:DNA modification methylase
MQKLEIEYVDINSIKPYKNNAKQHPKEQIEQIKTSIEMFGMDDPIGVWNNEIVEGHGRLIACKELGYTEVPIIRLDHLTDEERKAYTLAHNKLTMNSDFDLDILNEELVNFDTIDMSEYGFDLDFNVDDEEQEIVEDEVPDVPEEPKAKLGDIYQLGNHRLMCGDSTSEEDVAKLMDGVKADLVVTDPPYNVALWDEDIEELKKQNHRTDGLTIKNDKLTNDEFHIFLVKAFNNMKKVLKDGGVYYVWYASSEVVNFQTSLEENGFQVREELIWNKGRMVFGRQDYQWQHEPCLYGWKDGASHYFVDDRTQTTVFEDKKPDIKKMKKEELVKLLEEIYSDKVSTTIINENKPSVSELHPTMKPIKLIARLVKNSSIINEKVLDLFGGSGTTLITCEQLNRKCYMMEYDPHYIDVIIQRWENFTGEKAVKLN